MMPKTLKQPKVKSTCKGVFFRAWTNSFLSKHRSVETRKSLRLVKSRSCPGCKDCDWLWDFLYEDIRDLDSDDYVGTVENGRLYKVKANWSPGPYEYPLDGELDIEFVEVKEE